MTTPAHPQQSDDRAADLYTAGEHLWRAYEALDDAKHLLTRSEAPGHHRIHTNKVMGMVQKLAENVERLADEVHTMTREPEQP